MKAIFDTYSKGNHNMNMSLFWEYKTDNFDFEKNAKLVATRVISLGTLEDWYAAFDIYGYMGFRKIAKEKVQGLDPKNFNFMCYALELNKEETECYKSQLWRNQLLKY